LLAIKRGRGGFPGAERSPRDFENFNQIREENLEKKKANAVAVFLPYPWLQIVNGARLGMRGGGNVWGGKGGGESWRLQQRLE